MIGRIRLILVTSVLMIMVIGVIPASGCPAGQQVVADNGILNYNIGRSCVPYLYYITCSSLNTSSPVGLIVPLYEYPSADWATLASLKQEYFVVPIIVIINPDSGAGASYDPTYAAYVRMLQMSNIVVYGYVATGYGKVASGYVEASMIQYSDWYHVGGIFLDEMQGGMLGYQAYYGNLTAYAHSIGLKTIANPGTSVICSYIHTVDSLTIDESQGLPTLSFLSTASCGDTASNFNFISYGVGALPSQTWLDSTAQYVSYVWITDQTATYNNLPSYLTQEMSLLAQTP